MLNIIIFKYLLFNGGLQIKPENSMESTVAAIGLKCIYLYISITYYEMCIDSSMIPADDFDMGLMGKYSRKREAG